MIVAPHHVGYVVDDLEAAAERWAAAVGAGPFLAMEHIAFETVTYEGEPATYDHSSAFGAWGSLLVELTVVHDARPAGLATALVAPGGGVGHWGILAGDQAATVARLEQAGMRAFHEGVTGPAHAVWLAGGPLLGHPVEVLQERPELLGFYALLRREAEGWDGRDPLRIMTGPPA